MKRAVYYEEAKRLYVIQGFALDTITDMLKNNVSRKTLYNWKTEFNWDGERAKYQNSTASIQEDLIELVKTQVKEARTNPSPQNIFALVKSIGALKSFQGVDVGDTPVEADKKKSISQETIDMVKKDLLGL
jgi:hypothetical protein